MPNHNLRELFITHFCRQFFAGEVVVNLLLCTEGRLYFGVFGGVFSIDGAIEVEVVIFSIASGDVGNVPNSIGSCCIHDRTARQGIRETFRTPLRVVLVVSAGLETAVPECRVQTVFQLAV